MIDNPEPRSTARRPLERVLWAAVAVFLLDGLYVVAVFSWVLGLTTPQRIFQGIAAAAVGGVALTSSGFAAFGVLLHFLVALGWSGLWAVIYERSEALRRRLASVRWALHAGAGYGVVVWLAMQLVVLPMTRGETRPLLTRNGLLVLLAHLLVVGPPIVLIVRRDLGRGESSSTS